MHRIASQYRIPQKPSQPIETAAEQCRHLSSGTVSSLVGHESYHVIDSYRDRMVDYAKANPELVSWMDVAEAMRGNKLLP